MNADLDPAKVDIASSVHDFCRAVICLMLRNMLTQKTRAIGLVFYWQGQVCGKICHLLRGVRCGLSGKFFAFFQNQD